MQLIPLRAAHDHMRALGWYGSHLFTHSYLHYPWSVGFYPDGWTLSYATPTAGIYKIARQGSTLAELKTALRYAALYQELLNL